MKNDSVNDLFYTTKPQLGLCEMHSVSSSTCKRVGAIDTLVPLSSCMCESASIQAESMQKIDESNGVASHHN